MYDQHLTSQSHSSCGYWDGVCAYRGHNSLSHSAGITFADILTTPGLSVLLDYGEL